MYMRGLVVPFLALFTLPDSTDRKSQLGTTAPQTPLLSFFYYVGRSNITLRTVSTVNVSEMLRNLR